MLNGGIIALIIISIILTFIFIFIFSIILHKKLLKNKVIKYSTYIAEIKKINSNFKFENVENEKRCNFKCENRKEFNKFRDDYFGTYRRIILENYLDGIKNEISKTIAILINNKNNACKYQLMINDCEFTHSNDIFKKTKIKKETFNKLEKQIASKEYIVHPKTDLIIQLHIIYETPERHLIRELNYEYNLIKDKFYFDNFVKSKEIKLNDRRFQTKLIPSNVSINSDIKQIINLPNEVDSIINFYISDLHISHRYTSNLTYEEINNEIINQLVLSLSQTNKQLLNKFKSQKFLYNIFLLGDTTDDIETLEIFIKQYNQTVKTLNIKSNTFYILGNHETWNFDLKFQSITDLYDSYKEMLIQYNVILLENEMFVFNPIIKDKYIYEPEELLAIDSNSLVKIFENNKYIFLGGTGFATLNNIYNYNSGIYRCAPIDLKIEKFKSNQYEDIYNKIVMNIHENNLLICSTHMQPCDFIHKLVFKKNIFYISGHTHKNYLNYSQNEFFDNQVGYHVKTYSFKFFCTDLKIQNLSNYSDGIYDIEPIEYINFYQEYNILMNYNLNGEIKMLKRNNIYLFLLNQGKNLYFLNGGKKLKIKKINDIPYFYKNMVNYFDIVNNKYLEYLKFRIKLFKLANKIEPNCYFNEENILILKNSFQILLTIDINLMCFRSSFYLTIKNCSSLETFFDMYCKNYPELTNNYLKYKNEIKNLDTKINFNKNMNKVDKIPKQIINNNVTTIKRCTELNQNQIIRTWDDNFF